MALSPKKLEELRKLKRKRDSRPAVPILAELIPVTLKPKEINQFTNRSATVLLAIERVINDCWRERELIDDVVVELALIASIRKMEIEDSDSDVAFIVNKLETTSEVLDIDEMVWKTGLQVVNTSVKNHSSNLPGSQNYLRFASSFLDKADSRLIT